MQIQLEGIYFRGDGSWIGAAANALTVLKDGSEFSQVMDGGCVTMTLEDVLVLDRIREGEGL